ncbi:MAG: MotA/TolQ/ExbB proton channel family protein [Candidatus Aureabacteria bacterium]|nr:MotA/TolQ/ExbB proton channel family protein [Candidatus Auribacterota bacterium]
MKKYLLIIFLLFLTVTAFGGQIDETSAEGMTLWILIKNGGWVMAVLGLLSVVSFALTLFYLFTIRNNVLIPTSQLLDIKQSIEKNDIERVAALCKNRKNFLERVVYTGACTYKDPGKVINKKMEEEGRRVIAAYWQRVSVLSNIAVISPMLGLLGTVLGMIRAFNAIALNISDVKPIYLAYGVSQAMVTTAAGLIVGIFSMAFFFYFKSRLQAISIHAETIIESIADYFEKNK